MKASTIRPRMYSYCDDSRDEMAVTFIVFRFFPLETNVCL